ncbi:MAG: ribosome maturation factor RimP [Proteobacteria bacterium]|nr:ribosome maturation factor RimP [Pseudomonadota bacterium]
MQPHEEQIWQLAEPLLASVGMELVKVECVKMKTRWLVRIYMDRERGVTLDDCAEVSHQLGDLLDVHDVPPGPYTLEVSSPGLDRPLFQDKDFLKYRGCRVNLRLAEEIEGRRHFHGELVAYEEEDGRKIVVLRDAGRSFRIPREAVVKANLEYGS